MAKLTLSDLTNLNNETSVVNTINNNNTAIETALENTLSRDGTTPNTMSANLDMNSNRVLNLPSPSTNSEPATKAYVDAFQVTETPDGFTSITAFGQSLIDDADAATARNTLVAAKSGANTDITSVALDNTGLKVKDTDASHTLSIVPGSNLTANRTLTIVTGDSNRSVTLNADTTISSAGAALMDDASASDQRTTLGLGTIALQSASSVAITGGSITGITDLAVADGGTGSSSAVGACANLSTWHVIANSGTATARNSVNGAGDATEATVVSVNIPGGQVGPNGMIRVNAVWTYTNSARTKTMRIRLGGLSGTTYQSVAATTTTSVGMDALIFNRNSQASQIAKVSGTVLLTPSATTGTTSTVDTSVDTTVVFSAVWDAAAASENITLQAYSVEVLYRA